ncbi:MAG: hypothetical protein U0930_03700 [Pirellulales bacterium]
MVNYSSHYILPFELEKNDLLGLFRMLRRSDLGLSPGRTEGVIQLLERLILLGNDLREFDGRVRVKAQVIAIAARVDRNTVSDKTVRNWARDAKDLGILTVDVQSHKYGRKEWNIYEINVWAIRSLINSSRSADTQPAHTGHACDTRSESNVADTQPTSVDTSAATDTRSGVEFEGGNGRKWAEMVTAPRPEIITAPRAETVTAPSHCLITKDTHTPLARCTDTRLRSRSVTQGEVVGVFLRLGVRKASTLVAEAIDRGCDTRSLMAIATFFQRSQRRHPKRWQKPDVVLMVRLGNAHPNVPAWLGWTPGSVSPAVDAEQRGTGSKSIEQRLAEKRANQLAYAREAAQGLTMKEMFSRVTQTDAT